MTISATNQAQLETEHTGRIYFIFLDLAGDPFYACTGNRTYTFDSQSWLGIGEVAGITDVIETADIAARSLTFTLSGVDAWIAEPVMSRTNYKARSAIIYRGLLDADGDLVDDPWIVWSGRMDVGAMIWDETYTAQMTCEPLAARLLRANMSRYSDQDHQLRYSGDKFYEFLAQTEKKDVTWGGSRVSPAAGPADGFGPGKNLNKDKN